jgi:hypothetical protein
VVGPFLSLNTFKTVLITQVDNYLHLLVLRTRPHKNGTEDISQGKESSSTADIAAPPELQPFGFVQVAKLMVSSRYSFVVREFLS